MEQRITEHDKDHFHATMEWVRSIDYSEWNTPFAVTLKFWRGTNRRSASRDVMHFLNKLDSSVFKGAYRKHGKRLRRVGVFEGIVGDDFHWSQSSKNPHYHMLLESPAHLSETAFKERMRELWSSTRSGQTYIRNQKGQCLPVLDIGHVYSEGWLEYMGKLRTKDSAHDADVVNWYLHPLTS